MNKGFSFFPSYSGNSIHFNNNDRLKSNIYSPSSSSSFSDSLPKRDNFNLLWKKFEQVTADPQKSNNDNSNERPKSAISYSNIENNHYNDNIERPQSAIESNDIRISVPSYSKEKQDILNSDNVTGINIEIDAEENVKQIVEYNYEKDVEKNIEECVEEDIEENIKQTVEYDYEKDIEIDVEENVKQIVEYNYEKDVEENIEECVENIEENIKQTVEYNYVKDTEEYVEEENAHSSNIVLQNSIDEVEIPAIQRNESNNNVDCLPKSVNDSTIKFYVEESIIDEFINNNNNNTTPLSHDLSESFIEESNKEENVNSILQDSPSLEINEYGSNSDIIRTNAIENIEYTDRNEQNSTNDLETSKESPEWNIKKKKHSPIIPVCVPIENISHENYNKSPCPLEDSLDCLSSSPCKSPSVFQTPEKELDFTLSNDLKKLLKKDPPLPPTCIFLKQWNRIRKRKQIPLLHPVSKIQKITFEDTISDRRNEEILQERGIMFY